MKNPGLDTVGIARRISQIIARSKKKDAAFARSVGAEPKTIARVKTGSNVPSTFLLVACAEEGGVSVDWILTGKGKGPAVRRAEAA